MIPPIDQARRYLAKIDPAVSGQNGHDKTYHVACLLTNGFGLGVDEARCVIQEYNCNCHPPWSESEIEHKLGQALNAPEPNGRGYLLRNGVSYRYGQSDNPRPMAPPIRRDEPVKSFIGKYEADPFLELPAPMPDGTRELLRAAFAPGEGIRIAQAVSNSEGKEVPKDGGVTLSREEWLRKLDSNDGDVNRFMRTSDRNGIFVSVNPMKIGGSKDSDVTSFRHCLIEWDTFSIEEQWSLIKQSNIPCSVVILSGGKSLHAWINIDAQNRKEFDERVKIVYDHFAEWKPDPKNRNPSRFSRLAGCERGKTRQELIAVKQGAPSFLEWQAQQCVDSSGDEVSHDSLEGFDSENDPDNILGKRWLCKKGSLLFIGQSKIGKSALSMQMAIAWAVGRACFGIFPRWGPVKSMYVQSENDMGDQAEMYQGIIGPRGLNLSPDEKILLRKNLVFVTDCVHIGFAFCQAMSRKIDIHRPQIIFLDPLLAFIGDDISKQSVCSQFLREWIGPITQSSGVAWIMMHHTGKPSGDPKSKSKWKSADYAYGGIGSSELTNWARGACYLDRVNEDKVFHLNLAARGERAMAVDITASKTTHVWLRHCSDAIFWEQIGEPEEIKKDKQKRKYSAPAKDGQKAESGEAPAEAPAMGRPRKYLEFEEHVEEFMGTWSGEVISLYAAKDRLLDFALERGIKMVSNTAETVIETLIHHERLNCVTTHNGYLISVNRKPD